MQSDGETGASDLHGRDLALLAAVRGVATVGTRLHIYHSRGYESLKSSICVVARGLPR